MALAFFERHFAPESLDEYQSRDALQQHLNAAYAHAVRLSGSASHLSAVQRRDIYHGYVCGALDAFARRYRGALGAYVHSHPVLDSCNQQLFVSLLRSQLTTAVVAGSFPCHCASCRLLEPLPLAAMQRLAALGYVVAAAESPLAYTQRRVHDAVLLLCESVWRRVLLLPAERNLRGIEAFARERETLDALLAYTEQLRVRVGQFACAPAPLPRTVLDGASQDVSEARAAQFRASVLAGNVSDETLHAQTIPMVASVEGGDGDGGEAALPWLQEMFARLAHLDRLLRVPAQCGHAVGDVPDVAVHRQRARLLRRWAARHSRTLPEQRKIGEALRARMYDAVLAPGDCERYAREHQGVVPPTPLRVALWALPTPLVSTYWMQRVGQRPLDYMIASPQLRRGHPLVAGAALLQMAATYLDAVVDRPGDELYVAGHGDWRHVDWWRDVVIRDAQHEQRIAAFDERSDAENREQWRAPYIVQLGAAWHVLELERVPYNDDDEAEMRDDDDDDAEQEQHAGRRQWRLLRYPTTDAGIALSLWIALVQTRYEGCFEHGGARYHIGRALTELCKMLI
jgi:hypothetical protein